MSGTVDTEIDLDQLFTQRMKEKREVLEEKRQLALRRIRVQRVPGVNHDPFPEGAFERLRSNNIWEKVLGFLSEPSDVMSAFYTCRTFAEILEEQRMLLLLSEVLNVFKVNVDDVFEGSDDDREIGKGKRKNWKSVCLGVREVSKAWKKIADFHLFDSDFSRSDWFLQTDWMNLDKRGFAENCVFENEEYVDRAQSALLTTSSLRVRCLSVKMDDDNVDGDYSSKVIEFLEVHGRSVWLFCFEWKGLRNPGEAYERLCDMLDLLPNLKGLVLDFKVRGTCTRAEDAAYQILWQRLGQRQFPALPSLEHLRYCEQVDESLLSVALKKSINLKSVENSLISFSGHVGWPLMELPLEHYNGLSYTITSDRIYSHWPLKHLTLTLTLRWLEPLPTASMLFPTINRFRDTLQLLRILHEVEMDKDAATTHLCLDLPHLKIFGFHRIRKGMMGFDEILRLKSLEQISVEIVRVIYEDWNAKVNVKDYLYRGDMMESNVWKCFPNLKDLRVGCLQYRRQTFSDP